LVEAGHVTVVPPHEPLWQESPLVQTFPSLQVVPSTALGFEQRPVDVLQTPAAWHWSDAVQVFAVPGLHVPA
jgi:hypothetical protein